MDRDVLERLIAALETNNVEIKELTNKVSSMATAMEYMQRNIESHEISIRDLYGRQNATEIKAAEVKPRQEHNAHTISMVWGVVILVLAAVMNYATRKLGG